MSQLHVQRISHKLHQQFKSLIQTEDDNRFSSKALACFYLRHSCGISNEEAVGSLTDGFHDCGIDAIHINHLSQTLILVQSKYSKKGKGSIGKDCILKLLEGFDFLLDGKFDVFNELVQLRSDEISKVLFEDPYKIELVIVHTGSADLSQECLESLEEKKI